VSGRHPDGTEVEADMPRWQMSDSDQADVFAFLKSLPE
jgi:cytochrome c1